jgi:hypothetical protein
MEGEFARTPVWEGLAQVLDLDGERDGFATLEIGDEATSVYIGKHTDAQALGFAGAGEALVMRPAAAERPIACPICREPGSFLAGARSRARVCPKCRTLLHAEAGKVSTHGALPKWGDPPPDLRIGARGVLRDTEWIVTGVLRRVEKKSRFTWLEYSLFNPFRGYRWLSEATGHWSFGTRAAGPVKESADRAEHGDKTYHLFNRGPALTANAEGEFPWALKKGEQSAMADYIAPPVMLTKEGTGRESNWTRNEYLDPEEVRRAFGAPHLPPPMGVAPNQPSPWGGRVPTLVGISSACACLVIFLQILAQSGSDQRVWSGAGISASDTTVLSQPFEIPDGPRAVSITFRSDVDNDWLELQGELVDSARGSRRAFEMGSEYWRGFSGGEYWSEGSRTATVTLSSVPAGSYRLSGHILTSRLQAKAVSFSVEVKRNASFMSDFWITLAAILAAAAFVTWRRFDFERLRWSQSGETPGWETD